LICQTWHVKPGSSGASEVITIQPNLISKESAGNKYKLRQFKTWSRLNIHDKMHVGTILGAIRKMCWQRKINALYVN